MFGTKVRSALGLGVVLGRPEGKIVPARVDLFWTITRPTAVELVVHDADVTLGFLFDRALLMDGINAGTPVGELTTVGRWTDHRTRIHLPTAGGAYDVLIGTRELVRFIDACEDACPTGSPAEDERLGQWVDLFIIDTIGGAA